MMNLRLTVLALVPILYILIQTIDIRRDIAQNPSLLPRASRL